MFRKILSFFNQLWEKKNSGGFSLVEILVVITIIGILIGIVLVALGPAKKQGREARIKSDLYQLQNLAEGFYLEDGNYDLNNKLNCSIGSPEVKALCNDVSSQQSLVQIKGGGSVYCIFAEFDSSTSRSFCVDYSGSAKEVYFPNQSCSGSFICDQKDCPDFNDSTVVDCSNRMDTPSSCTGSTATTCSTDCPPIYGQTYAPNSDMDCIIKCNGVNDATPANSDPDCGVLPCATCPDDIASGGDGNGKANECVNKYSLNGDRNVNVGDWTLLVPMIGKQCP